MLSENKINLAARLREDPALEAESRARVKRYIPLIAVLVITLAVEAFYLFGVQAAINREIDSLSADIERLQSSYADALIQSKQRDALALKSVELARADAAIDSHGELSRELWRAVYQAADRCNVGIMALTFDRARGQLTLLCSGAKISAAADYIGALEALGAVGSARYGGYEQQIADGLPRYSFEITCELAGGLHEK